MRASLRSSLGRRADERNHNNATPDVAPQPLAWVRTAGALMAGIVCVTLVLHVVWLARFRHGYVTEWDESGYMQFSLSNFDALHDQGLWTLAKIVVGERHSARSHRPSYAAASSYAPPVASARPRRRWLVDAPGGAARRATPPDPWSRRPDLLDLAAHTRRSTLVPPMAARRLSALVSGRLYRRLVSPSTAFAATCERAHHRRPAGSAHHPRKRRRPRARSDSSRQLLHDARREEDSNLVARTAPELMRDAEAGGTLAL
jgi:hypothetical protein